MCSDYRYKGKMTLYAKVLVLFAAMNSCSEATLEFLWPLNNETFSSEVMKNTASFDTFADCNLVFQSDPPPGLSKPPLYTNGISDLTVAMPTISAVVPGKDFSFAGWFKSSTANGTLFHYKSADANSVFREFKIVLSSQKLQMIRVLNTETNIGTSTVVFALDTWNFVSVGVDRSNGKQIINVNENKVLDFDNNFMDNVDFSLPGNLRIGGSFDYLHRRFTGYISCFSFFINSLIPKFSAYQTDCMTGLPSTGIIFSPVCPNYMHGAYFINLFPGYSGFEVIAEEATMSIYQCALKCLRQGLCTSIQYNTQTFAGSCFLLRAGGNTLDPTKGQIFTLQS